MRWLRTPQRPKATTHRVVVKATRNAERSAAEKWVEMMTPESHYPVEMNVARSSCESFWLIYYNSIIPYTLLYAIRRLYPFLRIISGMFRGVCFCLVRVARLRVNFRQKFARHAAQVSEELSDDGIYGQSFHAFGVALRCARARASIGR